jgi:hypothetical protein
MSLVVPVFTTPTAVGNQASQLAAVSAQSMVESNLSLNVTTVASSNQDEIYVVPTNECHLWEAAGSPAYIRAEQPNAANLGVLFVVYGYYAFTYDRYGAGSMQKVSGTGLTTPAF